MIRTTMSYDWIPHVYTVWRYDGELYRDDSRGLESLQRAELRNELAERHVPRPKKITNATARQWHRAY